MGGSGPRRIGPAMTKLASLLLLVLALVATAYIAMRSSDRGAPTALPAGTEIEAPDSSAPVAPGPQPVGEPVGGEAPPGSQRVAVSAASDGDGHVLEGRVVDETGAGVAVFLLQAEHKPKGVGNGWEPHDLGPFHGGEFRVEGLPAGRWRLRPAAERHKEGKRKTLRLPYTKDPLVLPLQRLAKIQGTVRDPSGELRVGATVRIKNEGAFSDPVTGADGTFELDVFPGDFECLAKDELYAASEVVRGIASFGQAVSVELQLRTGGRIEGQVQDREGQPVAQSSVTLRTTEWAQDRREVDATAQGQFVLEHVAPGTYWLEASKGESIRTSGGGSFRAPVEVVDGETAQVLLGGVNPDAVRLSGTVYQSGEVVPSGSVWGSMQGAEAFASGSHTKANEQGEYELEFPGPGRAHVLVASEGTKVIPLPIVLSAEPEQTYDIHIPVGRIAGRVLGVATGEISRPFVSCKPEGRSPVEGIYLSRRVRCDEQGDFVFEGLPRGSYRVAVANVFDPRSVIEGVELAADGEVRGLQLAMGETSSAEVLVLNAAGQPVTGARVSAQDSAGHLYAPAMGVGTGVEGVQSFSAFTQGDYRFLAQFEGWSSALSTPVQVRANEVAKVTVKLAPGAHASIRVLDGTEPVYARLWIWDPSGNEYSRTLAVFDHKTYLVEGDNPGHYSLGPLPPGKYRVRAKAYDGRSADGEVVLRAEKPAALTLQLEH